MRQNKSSGVLLAARVLARFLFTLPLLFLSTLPVAAQQQIWDQPVYEGEKVATIDLVARPTIKVNTLQSLLVQKVGEPFSRQDIAASIAALNRTGRFSAVQVDVKPDPAGLRVTFILQPAFYIGFIDFPGATAHFSYPRLLQVVNYPDQEPYIEERAAEGTAALLRFFKSNGYFLATVTPTTQFDEENQLANVAYRIALNRHARFGKLQVTGGTPQENARLQNVLQSFGARVHAASIISGKPYSQARLQSAVQYLQSYLSKQNRLASQIRLSPPQYDAGTNRAAVYMAVELGPQVIVRTPGAHIWKRTLKDLIPMYQENSYDRDLVEEGEQNLVSYFQKKGYFDVKVDAQIKEQPLSTEVDYVIEKGKRHKVTGISFHGNQHFPEDVLRPQVQIQRAHILSHGSFSNDLLRRSSNALTAFYRNAGFAAVKVTPKVVDSEPSIVVDFTIDEGPQDVVKSLTLEGNATQAESALAPQGLKLGPGKPYSQVLLDQDRDQILASYLDAGYLNATLKPVTTASPGDSHQVDVIYKIQEGQPARIGNLVFLGAPHTRRTFMYRAANIQSDWPLSEGKLLESESRLYDLGIFDSADVVPRRAITNQSEEEVLIKAHEAKPNTLDYGFGFEVVNRGGSLPGGTIALPGLPLVGLPNHFRTSQKTFVGPRGSLEYSRRNLRGRGETATISVLAARLDQRGSFTYADPRFRNSNWSSLFGLSAERTTQNPIFTARLGEGSWQLERILDKARTETLIFRYGFRRTVLSNLFIPDLVLPQDRSVRLSTVSGSYVRDTRDKPLDAHKGMYRTLDTGISPRALGSNTNFARMLGQQAYYHQLKPWLVWANDVRIGFEKSFAGAHIPLSERFFSGGGTSLRGFPLNGAGPQRTVAVCSNPADTSTCSSIRVPVGGNELFIFNSEARFPIPIKTGLGGVFFYDGGNVYDRIGVSRFIQDYSNTVGFGLRYATPVGPIRFDIGRNLNPIVGVRATQFTVTLGQAF